MEYVTKRKVIDAIRWNGYNYDEICDYVGAVIERDASELYNGEPSNLLIPTSEGTMEVRVFDYIIKNEQGECCPCKSYIFDEIYELKL